ncbi:MAG: 5-carboxymethyl-2-hydroxymuconate isomerase [Alcaligenaceae bacterium]|nr:5-carboxymethyl-2-hydroxymuconate isomerase [Alcaligenaceae bacterium]
MPHLRIEYSKNLDSKLDIQALCDALLQTSLSQTDAQGQSVFPVAGTRVFAYPASYYAVADGGSERAFIYINIRIIAGRPPSLIKQIGDDLSAVLSDFLSSHYKTETIAYSLQIDEGAEVYDNKGGNLRSISFAVRN